MKKLMLIVAVVAATPLTAFAIIQPDIHIGFENTNGDYTAPVWVENGSGGANPAWDNTGLSGPEQVEYISGGASLAPIGVNSADGIKGDYFDQSGGGTPGVDGGATFSYKFGAVTAMSEAQSYTVSFWGNTRDESVAGLNNYVFNQFGANALLRWNSNGELQVRDENATWRYSSGMTANNGQWMFYAVAFDSTSIKFYQGTETGAVQQINEITGLSLPALPTFTTGTSSNALILGGYTYNGSNKYWGADIDEFRIHTATDDSAALGLADLEAIRQFDVVPEPATIALLGMGMLAIRRRKKT